MENYNTLIGNEKNDNSKYCFAEPGEIYLAYLPEGGTTRLDLKDATGRFSVKWYDPRNGGELQSGSLDSVRGGRVVDLGLPPSYQSEDWLVVVRRK